jgi:hypothetical protein
MLTPTLHITLPDDDDDGDGLGEYRHFAPILLALEAMITVNLYHIRRALKRAEKGFGAPIPPLYASGVYYEEDPPGHEDWRDCYTVLERGKGDCLPISTLMLRDDYALVPMVSLRPGQHIMDDGAWTEVREIVHTGEKELLAFDLSNGCTFRCSPEHRLFRDVNGTQEEVRARDVRVDDDLVTARTVPLAKTEAAWPEVLSSLKSEDRAWLLGVYLADGWCEDYRASISGRDGKPKEAQKRRVEDLMKTIGVHTRWHERYIALNDKSLAQFFGACGGHAPEKHLTSLNYTSEADVRALIDGLAADSGIAGNSPPRVFSTTSPQLAIQLRILFRMVGVSTSIRRVDDHGGLGTHPIYRVIPRTGPKGSQRRDKKFARVRAIANGGRELCADIETSTGKFWLPESDLIVHNCDNLVAWRIAELRASGINAQPWIKWQKVPKSMMISMGHPSHMVPEEGIDMVHVCVEWPDGHIEDPSKELGMGGSYTNKV